ncbi:MAG: CotH kinase family protein [Candidatus Ozemobacteraceae bacterium]
MTPMKHFFSGALIIAILIQIPALQAQTAVRKDLPQRLAPLQKSQAQNSSGATTITVVIPASEAIILFPADPTARTKEKIRALLTDGKGTFMATLSSGGQSTLKTNTPNIRVRDLEPVLGPGEAKGKKSDLLLAGVPIVDKTIRFNPMTMDDGYVHTPLYIELVNLLHLIPTSKMPLRAEYAKLVYRFTDAKDQWTRITNPMNGSNVDAIPAGLHLINFNPVKYLKSIESDNSEVIAVARSRYNVLNLVNKAKHLLGNSENDSSPAVFSSSQVKTEKTKPFRVEIEWIKKFKTETEKSTPDQELENAKTLKDLLVKAYSAPLKFSGSALYRELNSVMDLQQLFRFMAVNRILENGDISDEFLWYVEKNAKTGQCRLGIMPQDGDDMFKGAHFFPTTPKQIGLIINSSGIARKLGLEFGYIMNYEDPLFRMVQEDAGLFYAYLAAFEQLAKELGETPALDNLLKGLSTKILPYANDPEVLTRGHADERKQDYSPTSFATGINTLRRQITTNTGRVLTNLRGTRGKPGDLERAKKASQEIDSKK